MYFGAYDNTFLVGTPPAIRIVGYNEEYNTITINPNFDHDYDQTSESNTSQTESIMTDFIGDNFSAGEIAVYIVTDPLMNGDFMRGPYVGINLILNHASKPFELFAINVDYEKTKLDGSLG